MSKGGKKLKNKAKENQSLVKPPSPPNNDTCLLFSFRYLDSNQGQSLDDWSQSNLLLDFVSKLKDFSGSKPSEVFTGNRHKLYGEFPPKDVTNYKLPPSLGAGLNWGVFGVGNQKVRVAGFLLENTFYIVFLDKEHKFYKTTK